MKKLRKGRVTFSIILIAFLTLSLGSCESDRKKRTTKNKNDTSLVIKKPVTINNQSDNSNTLNRINFYFENSGSMNGYLDGRNFRQTMHRIIDDANLNLHPYFVNSKEYPTSNILSKIDSRNIKTQGTNSSDHKFIFSNAIENATGSNLSIVVTDGIYSTPDGNVDVVGIEIEKSFEGALNENKIETVVIKLSSNYKGTYYTESECENVKINQERPYYILLFGSKNTIDDALENLIQIDRLPGYKNYARFFITEDINVDYTILSQGEEKKGSFRRVGRGQGLITEIEDAERSDRGNNRYLQFGIGVDFKNLSVPESYLMDETNYEIDGSTGYSIQEIILVSDLNNSSRTYNYINSISEKINPTHIIVVRAETKATGKLEIELENILPKWIKNTGIENDCDVLDNTTQTFAFDNLISGISNAYENINDSDEYLELKLNIKH